MLICVHGSGDANQHQCRKLQECIQAFERDGHRVILARSQQPAQGCDMACFWGHQTQNFKYIDEYQEKGIPYLVIEQGFTGDRMDNTTIGWNGLNGGAFRPTPPDYEKHEIGLSDWRAKPGGPIIIMGQLPGDASLRMLDIHEWCDEQAYEARQWHPESEVIIRPHPKWLIKKGEEPREPLEAALKRAHLVVTYSSTTGVDAVRAGVPTVAQCDGSMAWDVSQFYTGSTPIMPDRTRWAIELSWAEWSERRIKDGVSYNMIVWEEARERAAAGIYDRRH